MIKICAICNEEFEAIGRGSATKICCSKECSKQRHKNITNKLYSEDKQRHKNRMEIWKSKNPKYSSKYYHSNKKKHKQYVIDNKDRIRETDLKYRRKRTKEDPIFKFKIDIRCFMNDSFRRKSFKKSLHTEEILGCTVNEFIGHIENKFKPDMTWKNHTINGWHMDHIIPLATAKTEEEVIKLCHFSNLQPLWAIENWKKGDSIK